MFGPVNQALPSNQVAPQAAVPVPMPATAGAANPGGMSMQMGTVSAQPLRVLMEQEREKASQTQAQPLVQGLAGYIKYCWVMARDARIQNIDERMLKALRARRGVYDPEKLAQIREMGGSEVYARLTSVKCRAAGSWLRDVLLATGDDRPWDITPSKTPVLSPQDVELIVQQAAQAIQQAEMMGVPLSDNDLRQIMLQQKAQTLDAMRDDAKQRADLMADKMEDQLLQGGFMSALDQFIDDITTFPTAIMKGPIVRNKPVLSWQPDGQGAFAPQVVNDMVLEWERVSPFNMYPSPAACDIDDGWLIERHRMTRESLTELIGVDGYDESSIRAALEEYGRGGLREWCWNDFAQADAEGKSYVSLQANVDGTIDALQFFGSVQGQMLKDWGMTDQEIPDVTKEYHIEAWLIGHYVIKATLNYDPLHRKPYYKASYEEVPGAWWGNSVADLCNDAQTVVNAAARGIVNNMGIASGPQVVVNTDRLPAGEKLSNLTPWKIWQTINDPMGNGGASPPISFFQPASNIQELMAVFQTFSEMADEYTGVPRYLQGDASGGAGRTASGLSMLVNNAGKSIKQVIADIDKNVMEPLLHALYTYNMMYTEDPTLKGDVHIICSGAEALIARESAQVRRNEFLAATGNPIDMQIVGLNGRGAILREIAKDLDMDVDEIVPAPDLLKQKTMAFEQQMMLQAAAGAMKAGGGKPPGAPTPPAISGPPHGGSPNNPTLNKQQLPNGQAITDNFAPPAA